MRIHVENNRVKFHPDPIWNNGALAFLKRSFPQEQQEQEQQQEEDKLSIDIWYQFLIL